MLTVIVGSGFVAQYPQGGGVFSVVLQFILGLRRLGCRVCWLELLWPEDEADRSRVRIFAERLADFGFADDFCLIYFPKGKWPEAGPEREFYGFTQDRFRRFCRDTDILLDLCYSVRPPDLLAALRRTAFLDLDPLFMQVAMAEKTLEMPHDLFFTVGQNIGRSGCSVPSAGVDWRTFWPPVDCALWDDGGTANCHACFSTVSQWWGYPAVHYNGATYEGSKRAEFLHFADLPVVTGEPFELALNLSPADAEDRRLMIDRGWRVLDAHQVAPDFASYRRFVQSARAEFGVAKPGYTKSRSGWFSDRSACYLAAGKPVLLQDTGFRDHLPVGRGLLSFTTFEEAAAGVADIQRNYPSHREAAREIAREHFAAEKVLEQLLHDAGL